MLEFRERLRERFGRFFEPAGSRGEPAELAHRDRDPRQIPARAPDAQNAAQQLLRLVEPALGGEDLRDVVRSVGGEDRVAHLLAREPAALVQVDRLVPPARHERSDPEIVERDGLTGQVAELFVDLECLLSVSAVEATERLVGPIERVVSAGENTPVADRFAFADRTFAQPDGFAGMALCLAEDGLPDGELRSLPRRLLTGHVDQRFRAAPNPPKRVGVTIEPLGHPGFFERQARFAHTIRVGAPGGAVRGPRGAEVAGDPPDVAEGLLNTARLVGREVVDLARRFQRALIELGGLDVRVDGLRALGRHQRVAPGFREALRVEEVQRE